MKTGTPRKFNAVVKRLAAECPLAFPHQIEFVVPPDRAWADCDLIGEGASRVFRFRFNPLMEMQTWWGWALLLDAITHEWSHARIWGHGHDQRTTRFHDAAWGTAYAEVYCVVAKTE